MFKRALGERFDALPAELQAMLAGGEPRRYAGRSTVTRGSNPLSHFIGAVMGLPRKAAEAPFSFDIEPADDREAWLRRFGRRTLKTVARVRGGKGRCLVAERVGGVTMILRLAVDDGTLTFRTERASLLGLPLPRFLTPMIDASASAEGSELIVESTTRMGLGGRLLRYRLWLDPDPVVEAAPEPEPVPAKPDAEPPADSGAAAHPAAADARTIPVGRVDPRPPPAASGDDDTDATVHIAPAAKASDAAQPEEGPSQMAPKPADPGDRTVPMSPSRRRGAPQKPKDD